jgi:hypothetical protein
MTEIVEQAQIIRSRNGKYDLAKLGTVNYGKHDWISRGFDTLKDALDYARVHGFFVYGY